MTWDVNLGFMVQSLEISVNMIFVTVLYKVGDWNFERKKKSTASSFSRKYIYVKQFSLAQILLIVYVDYWDVGGHYT